jgi:ribose-phosphate pyrophosphokinase
MGGLFFVDALMERGQAHTPELILPFVPGARQDRLNEEGDYLFTAKSVAREINARGFKHVTVLDPHSEVVSGMIDRCHTVHAHEVIDYGPKDMTAFYGAYKAIVSPDAGAEKRAGSIARKMRLPMVHAWKTRDVATGEITGFGVESTLNIPALQSVGQPHVLVVDDICDGGGTFVGLAPLLKARGIKCDLLVTHGIFSKGTKDLLTHFEKIYTTDSLEIERPGVEVFSVCKQLLGGS